MEKAIPVVALSVAALTGTYYLKNNNKTVHDPTNQLFPGQSREEEGVKIMNVKDVIADHEPFPKHVLSLDQIFFILLIDFFGADLVSTISTMYYNLFSLEGLFVLILSFIMSVCIVRLWKKDEDAEPDKKTLLQKARLKKEGDQDELVNVLMEVKTKLENQREHIREELKEIDRRQELIQTKLQAEENGIKTGSLEEPEERGSLREEWIRLDQTQIIYNIHLQKTEKLLEPIETKLDMMQRRKILD